MLFVAFTIGLFGSLHCVGMCGPLAIAFCDSESDTYTQRLYAGISYNLGRTFTYAILGFFFGLLGSFIVVVDLQKALSIGIGSLLVFSFLMSIDIDQKINGFIVINKIYDKIRNFIAKMYNKAHQSLFENF